MGGEKVQEGKSEENNRPVGGHRPLCRLCSGWASAELRMEQTKYLRILGVILFLKPTTYLRSMGGGGGGGDPGAIDSSAKGHGSVTCRRFFGKGA